MSCMLTQEERNAAAAYFIDEDEVREPNDAPNEIEPTAYDTERYDAGGNNEWLILTDEEADERTRDAIRDSLWAFNSSFLLAYVPEGITEDILRMIGEKCEDGNDSMLALVGERFDELVEDAIAADGRGHHLSGWDGEEHEFQHGGRTWYAYRN